MKNKDISNNSFRFPGDEFYQNSWDRIFKNKTNLNKYDKQTKDCNSNHNGSPRLDNIDTMD